MEPDSEAAVPCVRVWLTSGCGANSPRTPAWAPTLWPVPSSPTGLTQAGDTITVSSGRLFFTALRVILGVISRKAWVLVTLKGLGVLEGKTLGGK